MSAAAFYLQAPALGTDSAVILPAPRLEMSASALRPDCPADRRIFLWRGTRTPPAATIEHPLIERLFTMASLFSLRDATGYGAGVRKFHVFCDVFSIPEENRLPASFAVLHSFALWAAADPDIEDLDLISDMPFEPVAVSTVFKYLSGVRAWHFAQGWPDPLTADERTRIGFSLRGLENKQQGKRKRPPRPPVTLPMLASLKSTLDLDKPFDACLWAMSSCAFWGMMRFGEVSVPSRPKFNPSLHLTRKDAVFGYDLDGRPYAKLLLPSAKTARPGEVQTVFLNEQGALCPLEALRNLAQVVPARADDALFSWRDDKGGVRPMVHDKAMRTVNKALQACGWGTTFGHSFRIGGASFYLGQKVDPEIVRLAGRWKSTAYEAYIRAFEQVSSQHMANLSQRYELGEHLLVVAAVSC